MTTNRESDASGESGSESGPGPETGRSREQVPLIDADGLKTYYEDSGLFPNPTVKAVDGVSLQINRGETLGLVGESGCGKTTLGRTLVRLETPTAGSVRFDGTELTTLSGPALREWRQRASVVFQNPESSLNDRLTVGEIIREPLDVHDWQSPSDRRDRVRDLLDRVGLQREHYYRYPHQFSGGQRQRIAIARALAPEPEFIVLDEPVSALDVSVQAKILNLLADLQDEFGLTYLFIAHDLSVVQHIADRVAVMYLGNIAEIGPTESVFENPQHPYTHALLSAVPSASSGAGTTTDRITLRGAPPSPADPPTGCPFTTRCPMKIQPDGVELSREEWMAVQEFRSVIDGRETGTQAWLRRLKGRLGLAPKRESVVEIADRLAGEVDASAQVRATLSEAAELFENGDPARARKLLTEAYESVCDTTVPSATAHEGDHRSYCHRHDTDRRDVQAYRREVLEQ